MENPYTIWLIIIVATVFVCFALVILFVYLSAKKQRERLLSLHNNQQEMINKLVEQSNLLYDKIKELLVMSSHPDFNISIDESMVNEILSRVKLLQEKIEGITVSQEVKDNIFNLQEKINTLQQEIRQNISDKEEKINVIGQHLLGILEEKGPQKAGNLVEELLGYYGNEFTKEEFVSVFMQLRKRGMIQYTGLKLDTETWIYPY